MQRKAQNLLQITSQAWGLQYNIQLAARNSTSEKRPQTFSTCHPQRNIGTATLGIIAAARATMKANPAAHSPALRTLWR